MSLSIFLSVSGVLGFSWVDCGGVLRPSSVLAAHLPSEQHGVTPHTLPGLDISTESHSLPTEMSHTGAGAHCGAAFNFLDFTNLKLELTTPCWLELTELEFQNGLEFKNAVSNIK